MPITTAVLQQKNKIQTDFWQVQESKSKEIVGRKCKYILNIFLKHFSLRQISYLES